MKISKLLYLLTIAAAAAGTTACDDTKSYAELLNDEAHYINNFLVDQTVVADVPADSVFEVGADAPYYKLDDDGNLYMQVLNAGTKGNMATYNDLLYFRFTRYDLRTYDSATGTFATSWGNENDLGVVNSWFRFQNYYQTSSEQWGEGIQTPLTYLPIDCEVNLIVKSRVGFSEEEANVVPFLYHIRYFRPKI